MCAKISNTSLLLAAAAGTGLLLYGSSKVTKRDLENAVNIITAGGYYDAKNKTIIDKLHPSFRPIINTFLLRIKNELGLIPILTSGLRTFIEQAELHLKNKLNAKPGLSDHNYGFAEDMNVLDPGTGKIILKKDTPAHQWLSSGIIGIANELGLLWGGVEFKSSDPNKNYYDPVHFYRNPNGLKSSQLLALHNKGQVDSNGYVIV